MSGVAAMEEVSGQPASSAGTSDVGEDWGAASVEVGGEAFKREPVYYRDPWFWRVVAVGLTVVLLITLMGTLALAAMDKDIPDAVVAIGSTSVGALAAVLSGQRR